MAEQQSQKRGIRSDAQKTARAHEGYEPIPPAQPVAGAFGDHQSDTATDQDVALRVSGKRATQRRNENQGEK